MLGSADGLADFGPDTILGGVVNKICSEIMLGCWNIGFIVKVKLLLNLILGVRKFLVVLLQVVLEENATFSVFGDFIQGFL